MTSPRSEYKAEAWRMTDYYGASSVPHSTRKGTTMSDEQSIRDELAEAMIGVKSADGRAWFIFGDNEDDRADTLVLADAILASPAIRRIQAEAIREAVRSAEADHEGDPLAHIWDRADAIERGETA